MFPGHDKEWILRNYAIFVINQVEDTEYSYFKYKTNLWKW